MKKIIRLTESDLENIVRKVIIEQSAGIAFGAEGNGLKVKKETKEQTTSEDRKSLKDLDDQKMMAFVDPFKGGDLVNAMNYLKGKGLQSDGTQRFEIDPLTSKTFPSGSKQDIAADRIIDMVRSGLETVAKNNYTVETSFTKKFPIINDDGKDISSEILQFYPNFYDVLWRITQDQLKKV